MEYSTVVELPLLVLEIQVQIQVRTDISSNYIGCDVEIIHSYNCSSVCDPAIGGSLVGSDK